MGTDMDKAVALQANLAGMTTALADLITVPATARDGLAIQKRWDEISRQRAPLNALYRKLRKEVRSAGREESNRPLSATVKNLNRTLRLWDEIDQMIAHHITPPEMILELDYVPQPQDATLSFLYLALHTLANPNAQHEDAVAHDCFADIPMEIQRFELIVMAAYRLLLVKGRADSARFLDVGCGGATKVMAASRIFSKCDGLEYDPGYAEAGQRSLSLTAPETGRVLQGDALQFENYADYDVIYFYRPISDDDLLSEMQQRIVDQARPGTVILAPYTRFLDPRKEFPCAQIKGPIFVTGVSQEEADAWHEDAKRTGCGLIRRARHLRYDPGFWTPLLEAASFNGSEQLATKLLPEEPRYDRLRAVLT